MAYCGKRNEGGQTKCGTEQTADNCSNKNDTKIEVWTRVYASHFRKFAGKRQDPVGLDGSVGLFLLHFMKSVTSRYSPRSREIMATPRATRNCVGSGKATEPNSYPNADFLTSVINRMR